MRLVAWITAATAVIACSSPSRPPPGQARSSAGEMRPPAADVRPTAPEVDHAALAGDIYRLRCEPCHGSTGRADGPAAAALDPRPRDFTSADWQREVSDRQILAVIVGGGPAIGRSPVMPANPDLAGRPQVVRALAAKLRGFAQ